MSDKRTKPCGAESCCYMDDKKHFTELLKALELCAVVLSGERMSKSSLVEALEKARALIAKHGGVV